MAPVSASRIDQRFLEETSSGREPNIRYWYVVGTQLLDRSQRIFKTMICSALNSLDLPLQLVRSYPGYGLLITTPSSPCWIIGISTRLIFCRRNRSLLLMSCPCRSFWHPSPELHLHPTPPAYGLSFSLTINPSILSVPQPKSTARHVW